MDGNQKTLKCQAMKVYFQAVVASALWLRLQSVALAGRSNPGLSNGKFPVYLPVLSQTSSFYLKDILIVIKLIFLLQERQVGYYYCISDCIQEVHFSTSSIAHMPSFGLRQCQQILKHKTLVDHLNRNSDVLFPSIPLQTQVNTFCIFLSYYLYRKHKCFASVAATAVAT